jgi:SH3 domain protein
MKNTIRNSLAVVLVLMVATTSAETTRYISDELKVPVRRGDTTKHKIIRFLQSGTAVVVLENSGDFSRVRTSDGQEGWVSTSDLMANPSARAQLARAGERVESLKTQRNELREEIRNQKAIIAEQQKANEQLQGDNEQLAQQLESLQKTAARPVQLEKENRTLTQDLESAQQRIAVLTKENQRLEDVSIREWFLVGGGVSIGSLILGLIITRIPWRRRKDDWGGY